MKLQRRKFLSTSSKIAAGSLLLPAWACESGGGTDDNTEEKEPEVTEVEPFKLGAYGIQLYTVRDIIEQDPKAILKELAGYGYTQIESYEGPEGMFWGMKPKEFTTYLGDLGMKAVASHANMESDFERRAADAAEAGLKYLICPWIGPQESMDDFKRYTDQFNACGEICKQHGMRFAYHNHAYSFKTLEGELPQDVMMKGADPELVDFEMDIYWVVTAGEDPIEWFDKYPDRWTLCHIKDRMKDVGPEVEKASCDLGTGSIDFPTILTAAQKQGMKYFLLEQERYDDSTPMKSAEVGAQYLKQFV